jgi:NhaA family Na+:H+ antiporter
MNALAKGFSYSESMGQSPRPVKGQHSSWPAAALCGGALLALIWSAWSWTSYHTLTSTVVWHCSLRSATNNGLLTIFFLVVGWELAHDLTHGVLRQRTKAIAPTLAALGGMVATALLSLLIASMFHVSGLLQGWGVSMATDVAFVIGMLAFCGKRIPHELRIFLLTLAIADDLGSLLVLAVFAQHHPRLIGLVLAATLAGLLTLLRRRLPWWGFALGGTLLWVALAYAGTEPALAGLVVGLCMMATPNTVRMMHRGHRWNAMIVLPLFAFCSCGIWWSAIRQNPVVSLFLGIVVVRLAGKVLGIWGSVQIVGRIKPLWATTLSSSHVLGASLLCAMGFTVPLIFAQIRFGMTPSYYAITLGLLVASVVGGAAGVVVLRRSGRPRGVGA